MFFSIVASAKHVVRVAKAVLREHTKLRSSKWRAVRRKHLLAHPNCAACGGRAHLQVHHIEPYHLKPERELDPANLITLCMGPLECHLELGHGSDFDFFVPGVVEIAKIALLHPALHKKLDSDAFAARQKVLKATA